MQINILVVRKYLKIGLALLLTLNTTQLLAVSVNVYLKLGAENAATQLIKTFNQELSKRGLQKTCSITPYLDHHPAHITLYLAEYQYKTIKRLIDTVRETARTQKSIRFTTDAFCVSPNGYVMLSVKKSPKLYELSERMLRKLERFRDPKAKIPAWAAADPRRIKMFETHGSPGVLELYHPHISIFESKNLSSKTQAQCFKDLERIGIEFSRNQSVQSHANTIAIGIANSQGQIIRELATISLKP